MRFVYLAIWAIVLADGPHQRAGGADAGAPAAFTRLVLTDKYYCDGLAAGDINRDGKIDVVAGPFWYAGPDFKRAREFYPAVAHEPAKSPTDCMFEHVYDVDGDGDNDVVTALDAHGWGLAWFEQIERGGAITFTEHKIMGDRSEIDKYGVAFTQPHAIDVADIDGDGLVDIVVGKRRWAHGPKGDIEPEADPVIYWFRLVRTSGGAVFHPCLVDDASGVGVQVVATDVTGDGRPDILAASKLGTFVFVNAEPDHEGPRRGPAE